MIRIVNWPLICFLGSLFVLTGCKKAFEPEAESAEDLLVPGDWLFRQRSYPHGAVNHDLYLEAMRQWRALSESPIGRHDKSWTPVGPVNTGGRIVDVEAHPQNRNILYIGSASGGIFRSLNGGSSWTPVFDNALTLSIGDIAVAPSAPQVLYVGTGEANAGGGSLAYDGAGIYKSVNGGNTWTELGLYDCGSVGKVLVHPHDPNTVYVAAMGHLFRNNSTRGVFKSTDGGLHWEQSLFVSDSTGAVDLAIDPVHPDTIYAAMWERLRRPERRQYAGYSSGIYRSFNGGQTWTRLTNGLPVQPVSRIGLAVSPVNPAVVYAYIVNEAASLALIYRSGDHGNTWSQQASPPADGSPASWWWFGKIFADPTDENTIYSIGFLTHKSTNGGASWEPFFPGAHVDQHTLYIDPADPDFLLLGNDGGLYQSEDGGSSWAHFANIPNIQFYTCEVDFQFPNRYYGGCQDNGTIRTLTGQTNDWSEIFGGDGFVVLVDPSDNNYVYSEYQYGALGRSVDGGENYLSGIVGINFSEPRNWKTPVVLDPSNPSRMYYGTNRVYRSTNRAESWSAISPPLAQPVPGANLVYGTVTTIAVAPSDGNYIYAGTDDGHVWRTANGGNNWEDISDGLPQRWVTSLAVDPLDAQRAYVTLSGYRWDEYQPHVLRTDNAGASWQDIGTSLPEVPVNDIVIDVVFGNRLIVATDAGVYATANEGANWELLGAALPRVVVTDLTLHPPTHTLIAATYGRSMYTLELEEPVGTENAPELWAGISAGPNPFRSETGVEIQLPERMKVDLRVFDLSGRETAILFNGLLPEGKHRFVFAPVGEARGSYVARLNAGGRVRSLLLLRQGGD